MNLRKILYEYGSQPGPPTPVGQQPRVNAKQSKSSNQQVSQSTNTKDTSVQQHFANRKPQHKVMKTKTANLEREQMMKDADGTNLGVIVSKMGEEPNPESVVAMDANGEMVAFDPDEEVYISEHSFIFNKFDKMPLKEQLRIMNDINVEKIEEALIYKKKILLESGLPDNTRIKTLQEILGTKFPAHDLRKQLYAYWAIPVPSMIKDFQSARAYQGDNVCLRPILRDYIRNKLSKEEIEEIGKGMNPT